MIDSVTKKTAEPLRAAVGQCDGNCNDVKFFQIVRPSDNDDVAFVWPIN